MIIIESGENLHVKADAAAATTEPVWTLGFVSATGAAYNQATSSTGSLTGATNVAVLTGTALEQKRVMLLTVFNVDTATRIITVSRDSFTIFKASLLPGWSCQYEAGSGWTVYDADGKRQTVGSPGAAGTNGSNGALTVTEVEIDFGAVPVYEALFTVVNGSITAGSKLIAVQSGAAATGRDADENEFDSLIITCKPGSGQFTAQVRAFPGPVSGKYKINYQFS